MENVRESLAKKAREINTSHALPRRVSARKAAVAGSFWAALVAAGGVVGVAYWLATKRRPRSRNPGGSTDVVAAAECFLNSRRVPAGAIRRANRSRVTDTARVADTPRVPEPLRRTARAHDE